LAAAVALDASVAGVGSRLCVMAVSFVANWQHLQPAKLRQRSGICVSPPSLEPNPWSRKMSVQEQEDEGQTLFVLGVVGGVVALLLTAVIGLSIHQQRVFQTQLTLQQEQEIAATFPSLVGDAASSRVTVNHGMVTFYFPSGSAALASGTNQALTEIVAGVASGRQAVISGYHDPSGDAAANAELARARAQAVGQALQLLGVPAERISYQKPADTELDGAPERARRVEVTLQD
jgi:outer membrane protein OmpA-like peptidoglycan-associated protein